MGFTGRKKKKNMAASSFEGALHDDVIVLILLHTRLESASQQFCFRGVSRIFYLFFFLRETSERYRFLGLMCFLFFQISKTWFFFSFRPLDSCMCLCLSLSLSSICLSLSSPPLPPSLFPSPSLCLDACLFSPLNQRSSVQPKKPCSSPIRSKCALQRRS